VLVRRGNGSGGGPHSSFDEAAQRFATDPRFVFVDRDSVVSYRRGLLGVSAAIKGQTSDLVSLLATAIEYGRTRQPFETFMFWEDDFLPCRNMLLGVAYLHNRAAKGWGHSWAALRVSYGFNGVVVQYRDLSSIADYLLQHASQKPPDHLFYGWKEIGPAKGRAIVAFRHNLAFHLGKQSVVGNSGDRFIPSCYELLYDWLQEGERFNADECAHDDITPCDAPQPPPLGHAASRPKKGNGWPAEIARLDAPQLFSSRRYQECSQKGSGVQRGSGTPVERLLRRGGPRGGGGSGGGGNFGKHAAHSAHSWLKSQGGLTVIASVRGASCDDTCEHLQAQCDERVLKPLNEMCPGSFALAGLNCTECARSRGAEQPAIEGGRCLLTTDITASTCSASHVRTRRLCPCRAGA